MKPDISSTLVPKFCLYLDILLPEGGLAVLGVPEVVEDPVWRLLGVIPLHGVPVMDRPVDGPARQGGDGPDHGDDGE